MTAADWRRVIEEAAALGVQTVQFIGGEPTLHPDLPELVRHALDLQLEVEVYSNLARSLPEVLWSMFALPGVRLATSYYAADAPTHEMVTLGPSGSHRRTRANIIRALRDGVPLRVGVIEVTDNQDLNSALADLESLGAANVDMDRLRQVGRGVRDRAPGVDQLCGHCAKGRLAVSPSGDVWPCVFSRWLTLGNVQRDPLAVIQDGSATAQVRAGLESAFRDRARNLRSCDPTCNPSTCEPSKSKVAAIGGDSVMNCTPNCNPFKDSCHPDTNCQPN